MTIKYKQIIKCMLLLTAFAACKKDGSQVMKLSNITVIHAATGYSTFKVNPTGGPIDPSTFTESVTYNSAKTWTFPSSDRNIEILDGLTPFTSLYNFKKNFEPGGIYSLYMVGNSPDMPLDTIFRKEKFPAYTDSAIAVRVINLSPNSTPLNISVQSTPNVNEFTALAYKNISEFKKYTATAATPLAALNFQVKDDTGKILTTYGLTAAQIKSAMFKSVTIILRGPVGKIGITGFGVLFINNF